MADTRDVDKQIKEICKNIDQTNKIQELLNKFNSDESEGIEECIDILFGVFSFHILKGTWLNSTKGFGDVVEENEGRENEPNTAKEMVHFWLSTNFESFLLMLCEKINISPPAMQCKLFETYLKLVNFEHENGVLKAKYMTRLEKIMLKMMFFKLSDEMDAFFKEIMENLDIQYVFLKAVPNFCLQEEFTSNIVAAENCLKFFHSAVANKIDVKEDEATLYFSQDDKKMRKNFARVYEEAWLSYLRLKLTPVLRKKILVDIDTKVMPYLSDPKELIDFLTDSYDAGGVTSLLALNGLFVLINQHNLDYPAFYEKLYKIIDPSIFHMKYKSRFFHYIDLFLTSTHLPAYLVAAFIKKFSRMLLFTPTPDLMMMLTLIRNLLIRHQSTKILIHRKKV